MLIQSPLGYTLRVLDMMEVGMKIAKWGNSLALRLPVAVVRALGLKDGDEVEVKVANDRQLTVAKTRSREEIIDGVIERVRGTMPADFKFDREEANARK